MNKKTSPLRKAHEVSDMIDCEICFPTEADGITIEQEHEEVSET